MGPGVMPVLVRRLLVDATGPPHSDAPLDLLVNIGEPAVPELCTALRKARSDREVTVLLSTLRMRRGAATAAIPQIAPYLRTPNPAIRSEAAWALGAVGPRAKETVPASVEAFSDSTDTVRTAAIEAVSSIGVGASAAAPALGSALRHGSDVVRAKAAAALVALGPGAREALTDLIAALDDAQHRARRAGRDSWPRAAARQGDLGRARSTRSSNRQGAGPHQRARARCTLAAIESPPGPATG
jgi:HEAT repeat protein